MVKEEGQGPFHPNTTPPQLRLDWLLERGDTRDGDLRFGVYSDGVEAKLGQVRHDGTLNSSNSDAIYW